MELYYTDPLASAYMEREFGVKIPLIRNLEDFGKFYIHPDSYHIFEPLVGDLASVERKHRKGNKSYNGYISSISEIAIGINGKLIDKDEVWLVKIIQRNNKPFFWPEDGGA